MKSIRAKAKAVLLGLFLVWAMSNAYSQVYAQTSRGPFAYISNYTDNTVSVIDTATNTVTATISLSPSGGRAPWPIGVAVHPTGERVYTANVGIFLRGAGSVSVIDTSTNTEVTKITGPLDAFPYGFCGINGIALNPEGTRLYFGHVPECGGRHRENQVVVVDTATNEVIAAVDAGPGHGIPSGIAVNPSGTRVYMAIPIADALSVIDAVNQTPVAWIPVGRMPYGVAVNPSGTKAYVANLWSNSVSVIDTATNTVVATIPVAVEPSAVALNPTGTRLYVTNTRDRTVSVIDTATHTEIATVSVGVGPAGVAVNPAGTRAYIVNSGLDTVLPHAGKTKVGPSDVSVIDTATNTVIATVAVGNVSLAYGQFIGPARVTTVSIDIKPGSYPNSINLGSAGVVPVAILSGATFDAAQVDPATVTLAGAAVKLIGKADKYACSAQDVDGDGLLDLVCHVVTGQFFIELGDSVAVLEAKTFSGQAIRGEDSINIVP